MISDATLKTVDALLASIRSDEAAHGGLLSRSTIRAADEVRIAVARERQRRPDAPPDDHVEPPRTTPRRPPL
jgi:hypothetical protein